jgi:ABC-2 type transport system permease protein
MSQIAIPTRSPPGSISQVGITMRYEFLNYLRSRRFYILLAIDAVVSALLSGVVAYYRPPSYMASDLSFLSNWWGLAATFMIILSGIFFGGDAISGEFQNKTGYFFVPNPIRRSSIYVGKWLSAFVASSIILGVFSLVTIANEVYYFGASVPYQFGYSLLFSWFYLAAVLGFAFFFSSLFKSSSLSVLITAILFLFLFNLIQVLVAGLVQVEPWFLLTYGAQIIGNILTVPYPSPVSTVNFGPRDRSLTSYNVTVPEGLIIIGTYLLITAVIGLILFERKEFT